MNVEWSGQYHCACVVPEPGDTSQDVINECCRVGAVYRGYGEMVNLYVVALRPDVGPELWSRGALKMSMK